MPDDPYAGLEPAELWRHFAALNAIPRPPGHEAAARDYVQQIAEQAGAEWLTDARGNTVARVAASPGCDGPTVAVQAHLDMVCETAGDSEHDCERDPIAVRREDDVVQATGTTLGADNGIGVAAALALLSDPDATPHGPLELLFTVEEETGLHGASALDISMLQAQALVNLDSEDDRALTVGCAGGADARLVLPVTREPTPAGRRGVALRVSGLRGGHSGVRIHEPHANAIVLAATAVARLLDAGLHHRIASFTGGSAHNAIPREAVVELTFAKDASLAEADKLLAELRREWQEREPGLAIELQDRPSPPGETIAERDAAALIGLLARLPHGVLAMSERYEDTVETSANLAILTTDAAAVEILMSVRSLAAGALAELQQRIAVEAESAGAVATAGPGYPGWEPRERSPLLDASIEAYREVYGERPAIVLVHGGLECGAIVSKRPSLDAISFGPTIEGAHTPEERVSVSSVGRSYELLLALLRRLAV
ncbi:MAG TPA: beta-Ala-His dipeptidase [Solirubrobacteraceae bacterium]|jgi:dipeptidase D|nr:beta-Ala-His dipeptidase [Solirubrobacteraceae bacterium]